MKEQEKVKIEEVEELRTELVRRKEWIMEVERQKNESIEVNILFLPFLFFFDYKKINFTKKKV